MLTTNIHASGGIRTHDVSRRAAADLRLRPRAYWDRPFEQSSFPKYKSEALPMASIRLRLTKQIKNRKKTKEGEKTSSL